MINIVRRYSGYASIRAVAAILAGLLLFYLIHVLQKESHTELQHQVEEVAVDRQITFEHDVQPLLTRRCVVCHSCYDAPCQLKLSSTDGIARGANEEKVYNPKRLTAVSPTRLFIDAKTTEAWRNKGFQSVIEEPVDDDDSSDKSLMQLLLELKQLHPQPKQGKLPDDFTLALEREQSCPTHKTFDDYAEENPLWGMPYAMPELSDDESLILKTWLEQGAPMPETKAVPGEALAQVTEWEAFFNEQNNKQKLASRYIYEHLFHAHIHYVGTPSDEFYRLVRSTTPPGEAIDEIATVRPYDDPETDKFYYRLLRYTPTIVAKNHIVYEFSDQRMQRYRQLFIEPDYDVAQLPSYAKAITANPFKTYAAIPPVSRYRFMLDEARFFIEGFVKGPVCRGQVALNVIEDQFWVMFFNPDQEIFSTQASFLNNMSDFLRIPSERGSHLNLLPIWTDYWKRQKQYMLSKQEYFEKMNKHDLHHALNYIWDGNGVNPNAALTVQRHFDSASVEYGFVGEQPETAWIIDYPLLERIHYLLVAGFNVYGNVVHQLSTRIYMDFLRMEGEDHFLAFLPVSKRKSIRDEWYQGMRSELDLLFDAPMDWLNVETVIGYKTEDVQLELFQHIRPHMSDVLSLGEAINHCGREDCGSSDDRTDTRISTAMRQIGDMKGGKLYAFPEVAYVRVTTDDPDVSYAYSILRNKAYKNVVSLLSDERQRDMQDIEKDSLTVVDWLAGSYPNFFFTVKVDEIDEFVKLCTAISNQLEFDRLVERYGVRRTSPLFWQTADWFQARYAQQRPLHSGLYDLSRYNNL